MSALGNGQAAISGSELAPEKRLTLIHRVIVPDEDYPKEYAILVTNRQLIFIQQNKTRSNFWLHREMSYGTALITNVLPKALEDYQQTSLEALAADSTNIIVPFETVSSLAMKKQSPKPARIDFLVRLTMKKQRDECQVYNHVLT